LSGAKQEDIPTLAAADDADCDSCVI